MQEQVIMNAELGVQLMKVTYRGEGMVLADSVRDALKWDKMSNMVRVLKEGKEYVKVKISDLKTMGCDLCSNLSINHDHHRGRPLSHVCLVTEQGMWKLIATRRPHEVKDDPELATWLDRFQDWVFGEVLPSVARTGAYMTDSAIEKVQSDPEYIYLLADALLKEKGRRVLAEEKAEQYRKERGLISSRREAQAMNKASQLSKEKEKYKTKAKKLDDWVQHMYEGRWGKRNGGSDQMELF